MNSKVITLSVLAVVVVLAGVFWVVHNNASRRSALQNASLEQRVPVSITLNGKKVEADQTVSAQSGKPETLSMTSQSKDPVTVTVPGLHDDSVTVEPGKDATLEVNSPAIGTFPIIVNDMEAGTIQFQ
jgi:hypothetical protein